MLLIIALRSIHGEAANICFLEDLQCGDIQHGPIAAEHSVEYKKKATTLKKDFVFLSKWSELEPFKEWTKAEANAIPVVNDPDAMYIMKTDAKEWAVMKILKKQMKSKL